MGITKVLRQISRLAKFEIGDTIGSAIQILEWSLYSVRGDILQIITATVIRNAEGIAINQAKEQVLKRKWKKARKLLHKCVRRTRWISKKVSKLRRIVRVVNRIVKIAGRVAKFLPAGGKVIAKILIKVGKILDALYSLINMVKLAVDYINFICQQMLNQLRRAGEQLLLTPEFEQEAIDEAENESEEWPFDRDDICFEYEDEETGERKEICFNEYIAQIESEVADIEALTELQLKNDCDAVISDVSTILDWLILQIDPTNSDDIYNMSTEQRSIYTPPNSLGIRQLINSSISVDDPDWNTKYEQYIASQRQKIGKIEEHISSIRDSLGLENQIKDDDPGGGSTRPGDAAGREINESDIYTQIAGPHDKSAVYWDKNDDNFDLKTPSGTITTSKQEQIENIIKKAEDARNKLKNSDE